MSRLALTAMVVVLLLGSLVVTSCALFGKRKPSSLSLKCRPRLRPRLKK